jgi:hypothetical protein
MGAGQKPCHEPREALMDFSSPATKSHSDDREKETLRLEVAEKLPQGSLACGSQAFIATLLFDPSMSAPPIIPKQNSAKRRGAALCSLTNLEADFVSPAVSRSAS